jgi:nucleotide-binding universal stress UspA family protein
MFKSILVPTDGSPLAEKVFDTAIELARTGGGKLIGVSVVPPYIEAFSTEGIAVPDYSEQFKQDMLVHAQRNVQRLADAAQRQGVACETFTPISGTPADAILELCQQHGCDLIVIASHGRRGLSSLLLGSEAQRIIADTSVPVMVFR